MVKFSKSFSIFVLLACSSLGAVARPSSDGTHVHATRRAIDLAGLSLEAFYPASTYETYGEGLEAPVRRRSEGFDLADAAVSFVTSNIRTTGNTPVVTYRTGYSGEVAHHAFLTQTHDDIAFANTAANVVFNAEERVAAFGSSFVSPSSIASSQPAISVDDAVATAEKTLGGKYNSHPTKLEYFVKPDNTAVLTYVVQVENDETDAWFEAFVDAHDNVLVSVTDFVAHASYHVLPVTKINPTEGFEVLTDPQDLTASPLGWHSVNEGTTLTATQGNNIFTTVSTSQSATGLNFLYRADLTKQPSASPNPDAARTNAFYVVNVLHDVTYRYGFTEAACNFQNNNFNKGGKGNDRVSVSVQDTGGTNNANFATPADGQSGRMRMYNWNRAGTILRDGSLQNDILVHEFVHGVTNRMTGGGTGRCLQTTESGGLGEGWSDAMANWMAKSSAAVPDFVLAPWAYNSEKGIRTYPYSTSTTTNPLRYSNLASLTSVHAIGEVWANILYNVYANLVAKYGWSSTARTNPNGTEGNVVWLHLYIDALAIQPCNPTFIAARDAWIQADVNRYKGANACAIWTAFAARGLGTGATSSRTNNFALPAACQ